MTSARRRQMVSGLALIGLGLALYFIERTDAFGSGAVLFVIGAFFLAGYLHRRNYGLLVPAGILLGLGGGSIFEHSLTRFGDATLLGLGLGFIAIFLIALLYERRSHWWPLIPGAILILLGFPNTATVVEWLFENWPLILVLVGVLVFIGAFGRGRAEAS